MAMSRLLIHLFALLNGMHSRLFVRSYAFAASSYRQTALASKKHYSTQASFVTRFSRGGAESTSSFSSKSSLLSGQPLYAATSTENSTQMKEGNDNDNDDNSSSFINQIAKNSLSIAGSSNVKTFGGLSYNEVSSEKFRVLFVLGGPGAGKGTQSELILKNFPCAHLSAGQLLREETKKADSPHAALIEQCLVSGKIVPVEISLSLLRQAMEATSNRSLIFLIDGFPRNFDNLQGWTKCMPEAAIVSGVLFYECPLQVLEQRILQRGKDSGRSDDNLESLRKRFATFESDTVPVVNAIRVIDNETSLRVANIRGDQSLEKVWDDTQDEMYQFISNDILSANAKLLQSIADRNVDLYQSLCADETFENQKVEDVLDLEEGTSGSAEVSNACLEFISGTKATISYDRKFGNKMIRETRVWSHQGANGWRTVHFTRTPAC